MKNEKLSLVSVGLKYDDDIVIARQRARQIAKLLDFNSIVQIQIATAVSEIARNVIQYANFGRVEFYIDSSSILDYLMIRISDVGTGIKNIDEILRENYKSKTGMGIGIKGSKLLMDYFHIESVPGEGTTVIMGKRLQKNRRIKNADIKRILLELHNLGPINAYDEIKEQNQELIDLLNSVTKQKFELEKLNRELLDKERGIQSLYKELQERANQLEELLKLKTKFIYYITHEFKTPISSILYLVNLIVSDNGGKLTEEQEKQIGLIRSAAENLLDLANELLDLAKSETGNLKIEPRYFNLSELFSSLRGIFHVLNTNRDVDLNFNFSDDIPAIYNDMDKIMQILKNLIVNALKFTKKGNISVETTMERDKNRVVFRVIDTGIGIPESMKSKIFNDYTQIGKSSFNSVRGTGLGLSISKKFAILLGGDLVLEKSEPGKGSTFVFWVPINYNGNITQSKRD